MSEVYGKRLLCNVLHEEASRNPDRLYAFVYKSNDVADGYHRVTFKQVAAAANHVSHWLQKVFDDGQKPTGHPTIAYCGIPDIRYSIICFAAAQCGYQVFFPSTKNTNKVNVALLEKTACTRMVYSSEVSPLIDALRQSLPDVHYEQFDAMDNLLAVPETEYAYTAKYEDVVDDPLVTLHSSGSTGVPKVVTLTHGTVCTLDVRDYGFVQGRQNHDAITTLRFDKEESCAYDMFPPFHLAGVNLKIFVPIYNLTAAIFGPPTRPPTGALAAQIMKIHKPSGACLPPSIVEQLYYQPGSDEIFQNLEILVFTGGPLPQAIGDHICTLTRVAQQYGSTEMGSIRQLLPAREEWGWIELHPTERLEMQPFEDGLYEMVLFSDEDLKGSSWLYHTFPDAREWRSRDLFERHPTNPLLWRFFGRVDDILVFSSGEKLFPVPMESTLTALPEVKGVLVVGSGFPQSALLVELAEGGDPSFAASQEFWMEVEKANALLPAYGRVSRSKIITASADRPFPRAAKGTIIRRQTESLYSNEIAQTLQTNDTVAEEAVLFKPTIFRLEDVRSLIRTILSRVSVSVQVSDDDNLYDLGLDSVKTAEALGHIKKSLLPYKSTAELNRLSLEFMYLSPTINQLSSALLTFVNDGRLPDQDRLTEIKAKIKQYAQSIPQTYTNGHATNGTTKQGYSVAVTGTTGYFGSYILSELLQNPDISKIYCLNRSSNTQNKSHRATDTILHHMQIDFTTDKLGLTSTQHTELLQDCDLFIHNAWQVDFNRPLSFFDPSLQSLHHLINLTAQSPHHARLLFISSISATGDFAPKGSTQQIIPESVPDDLDKSMRLGYGESKLVAEQIFKSAADAGIPVTILRVGSLAPNPKPDEHWPDAYGLAEFLRTCKASGLIAADLADVIDWVPVHEAARILGDVVRYDLSHSTDVALRVFNLVHPDPVPWDTLLPALKEWCGGNAKLVSTREWVDTLQQSDMSDPDVLEKFPALRMWGVFEQLAGRGPTHRYAMDEIQRVSGSVREVTAIDEDVVRAWLRQT